MVAPLLVTLVTLVMLVGHVAPLAPPPQAAPTPQAATQDDRVCYSATVAELLAAQKDPDVVAKRNTLAGLGGYRQGLQRLLVGFLHVKVDQGDGALLDPEMQQVAAGRGFREYVESGLQSLLVLRVCVRVPKGVRARGELWLPVATIPATGEGGPSVADRLLDRFPFEFPADATPADAKEFGAALQQESARIALLNLPGRPYFDARARGLPAYDAEVKFDAANPARVRAREDELAGTYELFTGGRALQENLQVDRMRIVTAGGDATVDVASIDGITIDPVDWNKRLTGPEPQIEPLANWVPADQIYVAFPSFGAMTRLLDEMERRGDSLVNTLEPRGEDARSRVRLERQICLSTSLAARLLGPAVVKSAAFTASDPYLREGTDVALLLECIATTPIEQHLAVKRADAAREVSGCVADESEHGGAQIHGLASPDRRISTYSATVGDVVLVSNSKRQLERLIDAHAGSIPVQAKGDDFRFFRMRYPFAPQRDAVLIVLSDPFLRRFCGPVWRIAESWWLRCVAVLADLEGLRAAGATETAATLAKREELICPGDPAATFTFAPGGARCSVHGGAGFLTPVAETPVARATVAEQAAYLTFRANYQSYWRQFFDPIALEISPAEPLAIDVTVMPLIAQSSYDEFREFAYGHGELADHAGDPHDDSLWHLIVHVNPESALVKELSSFLSTTIPDTKLKGVPWLGDSVELYVDDSPFLDTLKRAREPSVALEENLAHLPLAVRIAIKDPLSFALFLTTGRTLLESSAPGLTTWENRVHDDSPYVVLRGREEAGAIPTELAKLQLCYATISGGFCVTLDEEVMKRALERGKARAAAATPVPPASPAPPLPKWLGRHVAATIDVQRALAIFLPLSTQLGGPAEHDAALCYANLPALDAWHARDAKVDPVEQHVDLFGVALVCPDGGSYAWDAALGATVCSLHGHPLQPKRVELPPRALVDLRRLSAGITFEEQGVRIRVEAERLK